ncbi:MAG TPA: hypothetical protein VGM05_26635, partial [Planctomycetaceae bacterium]
ITGAGLVELGDLKKQLTKLDLGDTPITDLSLKQLREFTNLASLRLARTDVTDAALIELQELTNLKSLDLSKTQATEAGIKTLQKVLPNLKIRQ